MNVKTEQATHEASIDLERNFMTTFRRLSRVAGKVTDDGVVVQYRSGHKVSSTNVVLFTDGTAPDLAERMTAVLDSYRSAGIPMMWRVGALTERPDRVIALLEQNGLRRLGGTTAMLLERDNYKQPPPSSELTIHIVDSPKTVEDWLVPYAQSFGLEAADGLAALDEYRQFMLSQCPDIPCNFAREAWFVGYCDGHPVCCANYLVDSGVIGLYKVGTIEKYRGRNFAKAIMEVTINHAWERFEQAIVLYASESGRHVYKALGFVDLNNVERYELI